MARRPLPFLLTLVAALHCAARLGKYCVIVCAWSMCEARDVERSGDRMMSGGRVCVVCERSIEIVRVCE